MIVPGNRIKEGKIVEGVVFDSQHQPAGIDLSLSAVFEFQGAGAIDGDNSKRRLPKTSKLEFPEGGAPLVLKAGVYKVMFNEIVKVPSDAIGLTFSRSSLLRMGASMQNAVWDPGYEGRGEAMLLVSNPAGLELYHNAKLVQMVFVRLEGAAAELYTGQYHGENK